VKNNNLSGPFTPDFIDDLPVDLQKKFFQELGT